MTGSIWDGDEKYTDALVFVPQGQLERFKTIVPEPLVDNLREGDVPKELLDEIDARISQIKAKACE